MKNLMLVLIVLGGGLFSSGCEEMFLNRGDLNTVNSNIKLLSEQVDAGQVLMTEVAKVTGLSVEKTEAINEKIDEYQPILVEAANKVAEAPTLIEGMIEANKTSAPINPYAPLIDAVLKIVAGIGTGGTIFGITKVVKTNKEKRGVEEDKELLNKKYKAAKRGSERLRIAHPELAGESFTMVGEERVKVGIG